MQLAICSKCWCFYCIHSALICNVCWRDGCNSKSCGDLHMDDQGVTTVEWLQCFIGALQWNKFLCFLSDFPPESDFFTYYALVLRYVQGFCIYCMFILSNDLTKKIFTDFYACDVMCYLYVFIFACSLSTFALYFKKCV